MAGIEIGLVVVGIAVAYLLLVGVGATIAARARTTVVCPADGRQASVRCRAVDGVRGVFAGKEPRIGACDRWPERASCPQGCVAQLDAAPTVEALPPGYGATKRPPAGPGRAA